MATKRSDELLFVFALVISVAALVFRRPDAFSMPWFYGEEGRDFFADAFNTGWASLFRTANGYFHLYPRLIANLGVGLGVPIPRMPWVNLFGALIAYLAVWRMAWMRFPGSRAARFFAVCGITLVPLGNEIWMNQTNVQWPLSLVIILLLFGRHGARSRAGIAVDHLMLCLACFTGPFALVLAPLAAWRGWSAWRARKEAGLGMLIAPALVLLAACIVAASLASHGTVQRTDGGTTSITKGFVQAAFYQLWFPLIGKGIHSAPFWSQCAGLALGLGLLIALWRGSASGNRFPRIAIAAAGLLFTAVLASYRGLPEFLSPYYAGIRNFYLPALLVAWALLARFELKRARAIAIASGILVWWAAQTVLFIGPLRYRDSPMSPDIEPLMRGGAVEVPIDPPGWTMRLEEQP